MLLNKPTTLSDNNAANNKQRSLLSNLKNFLRWLVILSILSTTVGTASAGFLQSLEWVTQFREQHIWIIAFLPLAGLLVGLLYHYYGKEVEAGNRVLIDTIRQPKTIIPFRMVPFVYLGTMATHLFGGSAGREGTAMQMAAGIADQLSRPFKLTPEQRSVLIIAAVAAGFGSLFGTPMAGAVFALEFIFWKRIHYNAVLPAIAASFGADYITKCWNTPHTAFFINTVPTISSGNLLYTLLAGVIFGACAALFIRLMHRCKLFFSNNISFPPWRPFLGGILIATAVWAMGSTQYIGLGIPTILASFDTALPSYNFLIKMVFTVVTLSAGFKGGEVTSLFFIGAALGSALSLFIPLPTALLAGMGFVAVFAGASKTPIACSIMAMELFGYESAVFISLACCMAYFASGKKSIYSTA